VSPRKKKKAQEPTFLKGLSESPKGVWPHGALHHGARVFLLVALSVAVVLLFPPGPRPVVAPFGEDDIGGSARETVVAEVPFSVPKTPEDFANEQETFAATIPPIFLYSQEVADSAEAQGARFFERLEAAADSGDLAQVRAVAGELIVAIEPDQAETLMDATNRRRLREAFEEVTDQLLRNYLDANDAGELTSEIVEVRNDAGERRRIPAETLLVGQEFFTEAWATIRPADVALETLFQSIGFRLFRPPLSLDLGATGIARQGARDAANPIAWEVAEGDTLIAEYGVITEADVRELTAYGEALSSLGLAEEEGTDWVLILGTWLLAFLLLGVFGLLLFFFRPEVYGNFRWVLLLTLLASVYFLAAAGISWLDGPWELLPITFLVLPVAILWDGRMALILALLVSLLTGALAPFSVQGLEGLTYTLITVTLLGGAAAALSARAVRRRSQVWIFIPLISAAYAMAILATSLVDGFEPIGLLTSIGLTSANATASAILAMGFIPVFEWFTGITTDQTLLEWADPNRPLLKSLSLEASGTYAHTISVANLGEAAANAIGANGLLCRVGIYYHDVGKMLKPQYFVENQPGGKNPHDKLKPHTSAAIVREHVLEGEKMAREEGVPDVVARFIPEHHGTQLIGFFYEKAREESEEEPNPEEFRYPGPKPQSKETAISMLADSVESATRALKDPTPQRVQELVKTVVDGKIRDGQLAEAPLTLREISIIQEQFVKVVSGMFHTRLEYPETKHITESPEDGKAEEEGPRPPRAEDEPADSEIPKAAPDAGAAGPEVGPGPEVRSGSEVSPGPESNADDEQLPLDAEDGSPKPDGHVG
jgi:putative nucleotidyltransferase with HDIG domain